MIPGTSSWITRTRPFRAINHLMWPQKRMKGNTVPPRYPLMPPYSRTALSDGGYVDLVLARHTMPDRHVMSNRKYFRGRRTRFHPPPCLRLTWPPCLPPHYSVSTLTLRDPCNLAPRLLIAPHPSCGSQDDAVSGAKSETAWSIGDFAAPDDTMLKVRMTGRGGILMGKPRPAILQSISQVAATRRQPETPDCRI